MLIIAVFGESFKKCILKPSLLFEEVKKIEQRETCDPAEYRYNGSYIIYRLLVKNENNFLTATAKNIRASVVTINEKLPLPIPLNWTHIDKDTRDISKGEPVYLDVIVVPTENKNYELYSRVNKVISSYENILKSNEINKIEIAFFEENNELKSINLVFDKKEERLKLDKD